MEVLDIGMREVCTGAEDKQPDTRKGQIFVCVACSTAENRRLERGSWLERKSSRYRYVEFSPSALIRLFSFIL